MTFIASSGRTLAEADGIVALAGHQLVVTVEQQIGRHLVGLRLEDRCERSKSGRVAKTIAGRVQEQNSVWLKAPGEVADNYLKRVEAKQRIRPMRTAGSEVAMAKHGQAKERIVVGVRLGECVGGNSERQTRRAFVRLREAGGDVRRINVNAVDDGVGQNTAQTEHFVSARASERQKARVFAIPELCRSEIEQPWVAIRQRVRVWLKAARYGSPLATLQFEEAASQQLAQSDHDITVQSLCLWASVPLSAVRAKTRSWAQTVRRRQMDHCEASEASIYAF